MDDYTDITVRVRYAETDQMGVAYYANHLVWFELGRTEWFRQRGLVYKKMEEEEGAYVTVAEARCSYKAPARYDELLTVRTRVKEVRSRTITFIYEILAHPNSQVIATGETAHVITDRHGHPRTLPERYRALFAHANAETK